MSNFLHVAWILLSSVDSTNNLTKKDPLLPFSEAAVVMFTGE